MELAVSPGDAFHAVNLTERAFADLHDLIPRMSDDELIATYQRADEVGKRAWLVQAHCLWEARTRKQHRNDPILADLGRAFGISDEYARQLCGAYEAAEPKRFGSADLPLSKSFYVVAGQTQAPEAWAAHAEDRKAEDPRYSVRDLRAEIAAADDAGALFEGGDWAEPIAAPTPLAVHFSSASPEWYTPRTIIDAVLAFYDEIDLDPCSNSHEAPTVPARQHYTQADDGLTHPWWGRVYLNPPYGREIGRWIEKMIAAYESRAIESCIALLPARTDTAWFGLLQDCAICFIDGRLTFVGAENAAPFPSMLVYTGDDWARFAATVRPLGNVWRRT